MTLKYIAWVPNWFIIIIIDSLEIFLKPVWADGF